MTPRFVVEDPSLPHQIVLTLSGHDIAVSCNCLRGMGAPRATGCSPLEVRTRWESGEAYSRWLEHMAMIGAEVA